MIKRFKLSVSKNTLNKIYSKIKNYPWENVKKLNGWDYGTNLSYLKNFSKYWISKYNWKKSEREINNFSNFITNIDGIKIHFIKEKGSGKIQPH